ncbi:hypothetical protein QCA50_010989 [Cerrena zonata]|uniref:Aminoglycoside phosphotransferase domain-containing protein n=1 Tax=Cerrena zonata TaxID=2478898 RepID=A0AAW0G9D6_9APHY
MPADTAPGPIGGRCIGHQFFVECLSTLTYPTVGDLEKHVNDILRKEGFPSRVSFKDKIVDGLPLCPSDLHSMIDSTGTIWAIDFGRTYFLPSSFMDYSLRWMPPAFGERCRSPGYFQR